MRVFAPLANIQLLALMPILSRAASANGTGQDVSAFEGQIGVMLNAGVPTGTGKTLDVKVQHSDDNTTFADVTGAAFTQVTETVNGIQQMSLDTHGLKQYIRIVGTNGTSTTVVYSVTLIGKAKVFDETVS